MLPVLRSAEALVDDRVRELSAQHHPTSWQPCSTGERETAPMRVVDLADEFGITTAETLELCERIGVTQATGGHELTDAEADAIRRIRHVAPGAAADVVPTPPPASAAPPFGTGAPLAGWSEGPPAASPDARPSGRGGGSGLATAGFVASLLGLCIPIVPALIGIVLGGVAKRRAKRSGTFAKVSGPATAAQVLGVIFILGWGAYYGLSYKAERDKTHATVTLGDRTTVEITKKGFEEIVGDECIVIQPKEQVSELFVADCADPHDAQVAGKVTIPPATTPGQQDIALERCRGLAAKSSAAGSQLDFGVLFPSTSEWINTETTGICIVHYADRHTYIGRA